VDTTGLSPEEVASLVIEAIAEERGGTDHGR